MLQQQQLQRRWHAMPLQQLDQHLFLQSLRWYGATVLFDHIDGRGLPRFGNRVQQLQQRYLRGVRRRRWTLLRKQYMHGREYHLQWFDLCGVRRCRRDLLSRQLVHERLLYHPLRWLFLRQRGLRRRGHHVRLERYQLDDHQGRVRSHHCRHRSVRHGHHQLRRTRADVLCFELLHIQWLLLLRSHGQSLPDQHQHRHDPVSVHGLRRQGPTLLRGLK